jgi:ribosomal protein L7Ae-like RNA K-turn-binding protein
MSNYTKEESERKILALLGFAQKAGKLVSGDDLVIAALVKNRAKTIFMAEDCGENTKKRLNDVLNRQNIPCYIWGKKALLGHAIGKSPRSAVAFTDEGFAKAVRKIIE